MPIINPMNQEVSEQAFLLYRKRSEQAGFDQHGFDQADWHLATRAAFFANNYQPVQLVRFLTPDRTYIGKKDSRVCRFCHKTPPEVRFTKDAHAIPKFLGNTSVFSYEECDTCNDNFSSDLEDHFAKMLNGVRTLLGFKGYGGVPSFKTPKKGSRIDASAAGFDVKESVSDRISQLVPEGNQVIFKTPTQRFIPLAVFKCLAKVALSLMPRSKLSHFRHTVDWIGQRDITVGATDFAGARCHRVFLPGNIVPEYSWAGLFRRRSDDAELPYMVLVLAALNLHFQIYVPLCARDAHLIGKTFRHPVFPAGFGMGYDFGEPQLSTMDLSSPNPTVVTITTDMRSETMERTGPDTV